MFALLQHTKYDCIKREGNKLLALVAIQLQQIVLFYSDSIWIWYSTADKKVLGKGKINGIPRKVLGIGGLKVVVTITDNRTIGVLDIGNGNLKTIYKLDTNSFYYTGQMLSREKQIFSMLTLHRFNQSGAFYAKEDKNDERKIKINYFIQEKQQYNIKVKQFASSRGIVTIFDDISKVACYHQEIDSQGLFNMHVSDLKNGESRQYNLNSSAFTNFAIVREVRRIGLSAIAVFVNSNISQILLFNEIQQIPHTRKQTDKTFIASLIINHKLSIGVFLFLSPSQNYSYRLQMMNFENLETIDIKDCDLDEVQISQDSFLNITREKGKGGGVVQKYGLIQKRSLYMHLILEKTPDISAYICGELLKMLDC